MGKIKQAVKIIKEKLRKKSFWLPESVALKVEKEAKEIKWKSESVLITHIINNWFKK